MAVPGPARRATTVTGGNRRPAGGTPLGAGDPLGADRSVQTRQALVTAAIDALREVGFSRASAREIARRANCNQALVFYHFGSVADLLLAALDQVSSDRLAAYTDLVAGANSLTGLIDAARTVFAEDLAAGHVTVLVEMITAAQSVPTLRAPVAARLAPWKQFAESAVRGVLAGSPVAALAPPGDVAHAVVAGLLGLELLAHLDGDPSGALALFDRARAAAVFVDMAISIPKSKAGGQK